MRRRPGHQTFRAGLDIGRVILNGNTTDLLLDTVKFLSVPPVPRAIWYVTRIVELFGPENVFLVSRCSETVEKKVRAWLENRGFYKDTGVLRENVIFCRNDSEKAVIAARLQLTHFVDDLPQVLLPMVQVEHRFLFRVEDTELRKHPEILGEEGVVQAAKWRHLYLLISESIPRRRHRGRSQRP